VTILYHNARMDTPAALALMNAILASVAQHGVRSGVQLAQETGGKPGMVNLYIAYLKSINRLTVYDKPNAFRGTAATFSLGRNTDPVPVGTPEAAAAVLPLDLRLNQRVLAANAWKRGQHAHRTGLLAYFYPIAQD
jgi:hypothetical protein